MHNHFRTSVPSYSMQPRSKGKGRVKKLKKVFRTRRISVHLPGTQEQWYEWLAALLGDNKWRI